MTAHPIFTRRDLGRGRLAGYAICQHLSGRNNMADLASVTEHIRAAVGENSGLGKTVKLVDGAFERVDLNYVPEHYLFYYCASW